MASATAYKTIGGQIQNLHTKWLWIHLIWFLCFNIMVVKSKAYEKFFMTKRHFSVWDLQFFKIQEVIWIKSLKLKLTFCQESKTMIACKIWTWPPSAFEAVAEAILAWSQWNFLEMWARYESKFGVLQSL